MGVTNYAVALVIQYGVDGIVRNRANVKTIKQRLGRAARGLGENGHFIWLVPNYVFGDPKESTSTGQLAVPDKRIIVDKDGVLIKQSDGWGYRKKKQWNSMAEIFQRLFDPNQCFRCVLLEFFDEPLNNKTTYPRPIFCCNKLTCQPDKSWPNLQPVSPAKRMLAVYELTQELKRNPGRYRDLPRNRPPSGLPWFKAEFRNRLEAWRAEEARRVFGDDEWLPIESQVASIIPERIMKILVHMGSAITSEEMLEYFTPGWNDGKMYLPKIKELADIRFLTERDGKRIELARKEKEELDEEDRLKEEDNRQARLEARYGDNLSRKPAKKQSKPPSKRGSNLKRGSRSSKLRQEVSDVEADPEFSSAENQRNPIRSSSRSQRSSFQESSHAEISTLSSLMEDASIRDSSPASSQQFALTTPSLQSGPKSRRPSSRETRKSNQSSSHKELNPSVGGNIEGGPPASSRSGRKRRQPAKAQRVARVDSEE